MARIQKQPPPKRPIVEFKVPICEIRKWEKRNRPSNANKWITYERVPKSQLWEDSQYYHRWSTTAHIPIFIHTPRRVSLQFKNSPGPNMQTPSPNINPFLK